MNISVEPIGPIAGWVVGTILACIAAVAIMSTKRFAVWAGKAMAASLIASLRSHWKADVEELLEKKLAPIAAELQIGDGADKWPNGSDTLPQTMQTIYRMVGEMQRQLEEVLTGRPPIPDSPDDIGGVPS